MSRLLGRTKQIMAAVFTNSKGFDRHAKPVELVSITDNGKAKFQWTVDESQVNGLKTLHGGFTAFIVDVTTTVMLITLGKNRPGVSIELNVSYMKPARIGEVVTLETECKKLGSSLAFTEAVIKNSKGDLLATAKHTKYVGDLEKKQ
ncbi:acyl-coenzyme A thioesterase 13-like [Hydractinia symbiolongicarpus]|uniref:acyl-coenzyme A thioesterase 13-like n=1 Tax=Hydractinia symbiolongicarpus TaxID=13093 RepID=UPI00254F029F|nr:acyl-coenzyme A thioesterase 13-like [Hydractinia symbiolongicarpus]